MHIGKKKLTKGKRARSDVPLATLFVGQDKMTLQALGKAIRAYPNVLCFIIFPFCLRGGRRDGVYNFGGGMVS